MRPPPLPDDLLFAEQCLSGCHGAVEKFRAVCVGWVRAYLARRGATAGESEAIVETLFVDCLAPSNEHQPLLATFRGDCPLHLWLARVALNRLITAKRAAAKDLGRFGREPDAPLEKLPAEEPVGAEEPILTLLHHAIASAFATCEAEQYVMLQLLHADGLRQEELAHLFGCAISTISRHAERARNEVRATIIAEVRRVDPWLDLTWDDLLALCRTTPCGALAL